MGKWYKRSRVLSALSDGLQRARRGGVTGIGRLVRPLAIRSYLRSHEVRKLQVGAGHNPLPGWLNTDIYPSSRRRNVFMNATRPFPLAGGSFDYVYSEHLIEHIPYPAGVAMLRESFRVLKPGGRIRIATPDLDTLLDLREPTTDMQLRYIRWMTDHYVSYVDVHRPCFVINNAFRNWGHQFIYDEPTLRAALEEAGFTDIHRAEVGESDDAALRDIESHGGDIGDEDINRFETMVLEARRP